MRGSKTHLSSALIRTPRGCSGFWADESELMLVHLHMGFDTVALDHLLHF